MNGVAIRRAGSVALFLLWLPAVSAAAEPRYSIPVGSSPSVGPADAPVVLVEFIDYQ